MFGKIGTSQVRRLISSFKRSRILLDLRRRPRHSVLSDSARKVLEWLGDHKVRRLGHLSAKGSDRPASEPPIIGANRTVREVGSTILPEKKRLFHGGLVLELNARYVRQARRGFGNLTPQYAVSAARRPFGFHNSQLIDENATTRRDLSLDQPARRFELSLVIPYQKTDQHAAVDSQYQRDNSSTGTAFRPFLYSAPASSARPLRFKRRSTVPSGLRVKVIRSPAFMGILSLVSLRVVV